jgi:hypothetical protein
LKKFATLVGSAALFAAALVPAIAATNNCTNGTTGPFSNNTCTIINTDNITVNNVNDARIHNDVDAKANTGGNSASTNTLGGKIVTGDASMNVTVSNVANINTTNITSAYAGGASNVGGNVITGPYSYNRTTIQNTFESNVLNSNTADVKNDVEVKSNTGYNDANTNTGPADIKTGDAWLGLGVGTHVNDNLTSIRGGAGGAGSNYAENSTTGPFSSNTVDIFNTFAANVNNVNDMRVRNDVEAYANTGKNDANKNTLGGDIETGDSSAAVGVDTEGNINSTLVAMAMGGFNNYGSNSVTGPEGDDPDVLIQNTRSVTVDNWNNKCESHNAEDLVTRYGRTYKVGCEPWLLGVNNDVEVKSDTGNNEADTNTGGGEIYAGFADLMQQVLVHMNDTLTEIL